MNRLTSRWIASLCVLVVAACGSGATGAATGTVPTAPATTAPAAPSAPGNEVPPASASASPAASPSQPASAAPATPAPATPSPSASVAGSPSTSPSASPSAAPSPTASAPPSAALAWRRLAGASGGSEAPAAREDHTWTVDAAGEVAYLFGGRDGGTTFDDLWRYDLATDEWSRLAPAGDSPAARFGHTGTWVDGVGLVVWSGQKGSTFYDDIWAYDPAGGTWRELPNGGDRPLSRYGSCAALGPDGRLWISHGFTSDEGRFFDTRAYDFTNGKWTDLTPAETPVLRCLHDCLWTPDGRFFLYGGQTTGAPAIGDLWSLQPGSSNDAPGTWTQLAKPEPEARQLYALASEGARAWVFGGGDPDREKLDDLWALDLGSGSWTELEPEGDGPGGRSGATFVSDPARGRLLLFGGTTADAALSELWSLTLP